MKADLAKVSVLSSINDNPNLRELLRNAEERLEAMKMNLARRRKKKRHKRSR